MQSYFGSYESQGSGSGIIISQNGYIVTNNHVIENAKSIKIYLSSGETKEATVVGTDSRTDLAVLKMEKGTYPYATLGDSSVLEVGELCVAIGNPLGMEFAGSVTVGYISALNRTVEADGKTFNLIQTDAAINAGNSGGALVNTKGEVIGINTLKISSAGVEGLGFAIPVDEAKPIFDDLINHGYVKGRPVIGITGKDISADLAKYYNYPEGVFVEQIMEGSGAAQAGIRRGDIITKVDGKRIKTIKEINALRDKKKAGDKVTLERDRSGQIMTVDVILGEEKAN
jgi:serine protease Do